MAERVLWAVAIVLAAPLVAVAFVALAGDITARLRERDGACAGRDRG